MIHWPMRFLSTLLLTFLLTAFVLFTPISLVAQNKTAPQKTQKDEAALKELLMKMDDLYRSSSSSATVEMQITTPHWQRTLTMEFWSLGMEKTFIRILAPKKENGIATLRMGNEMWNFLPNTNKTMKIPPSMMMGSWMGSDFTNDDLVKEYTFINDYSYEETPVENPEAGILYIKCTPKPDLPIVWGWIVMAVREKDKMPQWYKYYDEKGKLMRAMYYKEETEFSGRRIPAVMELIPSNKEGHKTVIRYLKATFDANIDPDIFSLRNLRKQ